MRRGFKTEAEATAVETRTELGVGPVDPLDPWRLARHLDIEVIGLSTLAVQVPDATAQLLHRDPGAFSAVTVFDGATRTIWHNDGHSPGRQASNVTHEASHALLLHLPNPALDDFGCRDWDRDLEEEADWLAGVLLMPAAATLAVARDGISDAEAAIRYGVSERMARWRLNATAARMRAARSHRRKARLA